MSQHVENLDALRAHTDRMAAAHASASKSAIALVQQRDALAEELEAFKRSSAKESASARAAASRTVAAAEREKQTEIEKLSAYRQKLEAQRLRLQAVVS